jgi:serine/threonine protein kinase
MGNVSRFGPYELVRRLGSGGMAETFLAIRRGPGGFEQHVCVKRILPALEADPIFVAQFMEEARLAAQLRHASITQVVDFGEVQGSHYLALELVDGMDLRQLLLRTKERGQRLDPAIVVHVGLDLASALDFAHLPERGRDPVIHRDISPSNVVLSRGGEVYLTDFGIARAVGQKRLTESGVVRGKVPYMAAEYAMHGAFDARSDLFGLGVVLFEALAGARPFEGTTDLDTLRRIEEGRHPPLASLRSDANATLVAIIEQLIRPHSEERFQSARALLEALSTIAPPPTVARELGELIRVLSPSLSDSLKISSPSRTAAVLGAPPPSYPDVHVSSPDEVTSTREADEDLRRTSVDRGADDSGTRELWASTDPSRVSFPSPGAGWAATDPTHVSQHDRPSPYAPQPAQPATASARPAVVPSARPAAVPSARPAAVPSARPAAVPSARPAATPRRAPLAQTKLMQDVVTMGEAPVSQAPPPAAPPTAAPSRRGLWIVLGVLGVLAFLGATAAAYYVVHMLKTGAL